jgi:quercetin dioxygenase-like cupin family protein
MSLHRDFDLQPLIDPGDPDDWRPSSSLAFASDERADLAVIIEEIGVGDAIPLHVHAIDEAILYQSGTAAVRVGEETYEVVAGDVVFVPAGEPHGTRNVGAEPVRLQAVFPSHRIDIRYLERNPAPGTEGDSPQPGAILDTRTGAVEPL